MNGSNKIRETVRNRKQGNCRAGKTCYTNGITCKYLLPEQIDFYIKLGWYKGTLRKPLTEEQKDRISKGTIKGMDNNITRNKLTKAAIKNSNKERFLTVRRKNTITMTPHEEYISEFMAQLGFEYEPRILISEYKKLNPNLHLANYYKPDFANLDLKIAIELDGKSHKRYGESLEIDKKKERALEYYGYITYRFKNKDVYTDKFKNTILSIVSKGKEGDNR